MQRQSDNIKPKGFYYYLIKVKEFIGDWYTFLEFLIKNPPKLPEHTLKSDNTHDRLKERGAKDAEFALNHGPYVASILSVILSVLSVLLSILNFYIKGVI